MGSSHTSMIQMMEKFEQMIFEIKLLLSSVTLLHFDNYALLCMSKRFCYHLVILETL